MVWRPSGPPLWSHSVTHAPLPAYEMEWPVDAQCAHPSPPPPACLQGDQRTHSHVVALRAVTSGDGMTADWYAFTPAFMREVSTRICNKVC